MYSICGVFMAYISDISGFQLFLSDYQFLLVNSPLALVTVNQLVISIIASMRVFFK